MAKTKELVEGINILLRYSGYPDGYHVGIGYKVVRFYPTESPVNNEDLIRLHEISWRQEIDDGHEEWLPEHYSQEHSWFVYV
jgi:hypothetical protein